MAAGLNKVACVLMLCVLVAAAPMANAMTCSQVTTAMRPCIGYLRSGAALSSACCGGVKSLVRQARTTADRQQACQCLKTAAGTIHKISLTLAAGLPRRCGVNIPYKISPSTDCKRVK